MYTKYGWKLEISDYENGKLSFGMSFNTNVEWGENERELFICMYLFKKGIMLGKYHYTVY